MWKCHKCNNEFERLKIAWGTSGGMKVDVLDYFCPHCGNTDYREEPQITFLGTKEDREMYWNAALAAETKGEE